MVMERAREYANDAYPNYVNLSDERDFWMREFEKLGDSVAKAIVVLKTYGFEDKVIADMLEIHPDVYADITGVEIEPEEEVEKDEDEKEM